jgi:hypothetical protein
MKLFKDEDETEITDEMKEWLDKAFEMLNDDPIIIDLKQLVVRIHLSIIAYKEKGNKAALKLQEDLYDAFMGTISAVIKDYSEKNENNLDVIEGKQ